MEITIKSWLFSTFWGWLLGVVFILLFSGILDNAGIDGMQFYLGLGMGGGVGLTQWLRLRKEGIGMNWFWANLLGMGIPFLLLDLAYPNVHDWKLPIGILVGAIVAGVLQANILKKLKVSSKYWILSTTLGWGIALLLLNLIDYTQQFKGSGIQNLFLALLNLGIILAGGIELGITTGWVIRSAKKP